VITPQDTAELIRSLKENAARLGLTWTRRYGRVQSVTGVVARVVLDGDDDTDQKQLDPAQAHVRCNSLVGALLPGARVAVDSVPPDAHYVVGIISNPYPGRRLLSITEADATGDLTLGTSPADVPGCSVAVTMPVAGWYKVIGVYDFQYTASGNAIAQGFLNIDTVNQTAEAHLDGGGTTTIRATVSQQWTGTLAVGAHTLKLQAQKSAAAATLRSRISHTVIVVEAWIPEWV
jgi:hypothetical protein